ncbi:universal stress protein family domain containing protein [Sporothrix brasiliensis 5110]|uniref:Universal stress protein family domain containing protein n=1 Tax=Sporothrix brasiliensis 5110 TaxID=1398154 RepID=A0A0C2FT62_9PEZI|nr:universal stress protein family domain containing protein [Sporothrix brasiliensis 5110]KIH94198.1 universal stress protein family domain containing protein [Sporothrix brasiliensis 5110]
MAHKPMSMEAVMDEERLEVLALLGSRSDRSRRSSSIASAGRSTSPYSNNPRSPMRSPMQSILDYDDLEAPPETSNASAAGASNASRQSSPRPAVQQIRSMLDIDPVRPPPVPIRSMLDVDSPPTPTIQPVFSAQSSPTEPKQLPASHHRHNSSGSGGGGSVHHPRSMSDAAGHPVSFGPRAHQGRSDRPDPTANYQFADIITNRESPILTKRSGMSSSHAAGPGSKRGTSMAEVMRGTDVSNLKLPGHSLPLHGRSATGGVRSKGPSHKSQSPHNRLGVRTKSPHTGINTRALSPAGAAFLADSQGYDMQNAYRRLSDFNIRRAGGGSLSELPMRGSSTNGSGRLAKDYMSPDGEELLEDSSEDNHSSSSDEEGERGRKTARSFTDEKSPPPSESPVDSRKSGRQSLSLLAAAEEERIHVASTQPYRSLLEPEIVVTNSSGDKVKAKSGVHPANSFDASRSESRTRWDSDNEAEYTDIKSAQKLTLSMTPIMSTPATQRSIRIIYRGDFAKVQKEAGDDEHRRVRKYVVATDLSDESTHALEWAIGTVLRDGDTLVAIYCVDEETGIPGGTDSQDEPKTTREQAQAVSATTATGRLPETHSLSALATATASSAALSVAAPPASARPSLILRNNDSSALGTGASASPAPQRSRAEEERHRAVQDITDRIARLLRKTRLQVRVIVEVLHCKTPRHLLTEVIDLVDPTLVILGSRGRSALKGVILGSFSNYLVTKSSVPVMVARKRLRKQSKYKRTAFNQVNNLSNPTARSLANAKID